MAAHDGQNASSITQIGGSSGNGNRLPSANTRRVERLQSGIYQNGSSLGATVSQGQGGTAILSGAAASTVTQYGSGWNASVNQYSGGSTSDVYQNGTAWHLKVLRSIRRTNVTGSTNYSSVNQSAGASKVYQDGTGGTNYSAINQSGNGGVNINQGYTATFSSDGATSAGVAALRVHQQLWRVGRPALGTVNVYQSGMLGQLNTIADISDRTPQEQPP